MFSTRTVPWMKLGELADEAKTAAEAAKAGGIDFTVKAEPVYGGNPGKMVKIPTRKALFREDTHEWLSIVSKDYPIIQYVEAFDFMDSVSPHFVAAGSLRGGKQAFMVVELDASINIEDDPHKLFAVLRTSHDCSRAVEVSAMPLRSRCMNQLTLNTFSKDAKYRWAIVHAGDVKGKLAQAHKSLAELSAYAKTYEGNVKRLINVKVSDERAAEVLKFALPNRPKRDEQIAQIVSGWHERETIGFEGTGWGLVNAVSEYFDWMRQSGTAESRFLGALQGPTHNAINKTTTYLLTRS
jgi:phage/plasmid-like protein (TIGR03299 family)